MTSLDNIICTICDAGDNENNLLLCDGCPRAMHTTCIGMSCIPAGDWFCMSCQKKGSQKKDCWANLKTESLPTKEVPTRDSKVVVYLRVSSKGQDQPEYGRDGLQTQLHSILDFCIRFGIVILETFSEIGSARNPANLEAQTKMVKKMTARKNQKTCILVYSVSRFSRNTNQGLEMLQRLHANDCYVFSVSENISSYETKFTELLAQAQQHSDQLSIVVRDSIARRRAQGEFVGIVPYGFKRDGKTIIINPLELDGLKVFVKHMASPTQVNVDLEPFAPRSGTWTTAKVKKMFEYLKEEPFATLIQSLNYQGAVSCGL